MPVNSAAASLSSAVPTPPPRLSLRFLDGLRGLAALYVVLHHAKMLLWEGYSTGYALHPQNYSLARRLAMYGVLCFAGGHQAVLFFFVLSGFVIHLGYARALHSNNNVRFDAQGFLVRRSRRLYPPLLFAIAVTFAADSIGMAHNLPIYAHHTPYPIINDNITLRHDAQTLLGNLLFLMTWKVPVWGSDSPLWSLHYEGWFYAVYPMFFVLTRRSIGLATGAIALLFALSFFPALWGGIFLREIFSLMLSWWMGALLADVYAGRLVVPFARLAWLLPACLLVRLFHIANQTVSNTLWAVSFTGLLAWCFSRLQGGKPLRALEKLGPLGDMSYTQYVVHFPLMALLSGFLMARAPGHVLPESFGWFCAGTVITLACAYVAHFAVETPFVRKRARPVLTISPN